jgi:hypothetical protein
MLNKVSRKRTLAKKQQAGGHDDVDSGEISEDTDVESASSQSDLESNDPLVDLKGKAKRTQAREPLEPTDPNSNSRDKPETNVSFHRGIVILSLCANNKAQQ